jgi:hypothetical protein
VVGDHINLHLLQHSSKVRHFGLAELIALAVLYHGRTETWSILPIGLFCLLIGRRRLQFETNTYKVNSNTIEKALEHGEVLGKLS